MKAESAADEARLDQIEEPPEGRSHPGSGALLVLEAMRPEQWSKNAFVFAGMIFAGAFLELDAQVAAWTTFASFCLVSGAAYLLNDVLDAEADRHSPRTASRPVARGDVSQRSASVAAGLAAVAGLALAALVNWEALAALGGFLALQVAYSSLLKHVLFVDVMAISAGFVLRAAAGGLAVEVHISPWLLLATGLLAVFLGLSKRRAEAVVIGGGVEPRRAVLDQYSVELLDELIAVVTPSTVVVYAVYAVIGAQTDLMLLTVPFVLYGIFRLLYLMHHRLAVTEEPAVLVWRDRPLLWCVILWGLSSAAIAAAAGG